jgi:hypothetical protein
LKIRPRTLLTIMLIPIVSACGMSSDERERKESARQAAMEKALADSVTEERDKDRRMREAAAEQADDRLAREDAQAASEAVANAEREAPQKAIADALQRYTDRLRQSVPNGSSLQVRKAMLSPSSNGMCAEFAGRDKGGATMPFKRVVVTETRAAPEEAPVKETLTQFLLFQLAARDTGCFPDVQSVRILQ